MIFLNNYQEEVEKIIAKANQMVAEADQMVAEADQMAPEADNEENVNIEIVNEKFDESIDDISSVAFAESDEEEVKEEKLNGCYNSKIYREESELIIAQIEIYNTEEMELIRIIHFDHLNKPSAVFLDSLKVVIPH